jgi:hypothetical protein
MSRRDRPCSYSLYSLIEVTVSIWTDEPIAHSFETVLEIFVQKDYDYTDNRFQYCKSTTDN